MCVCVCVRRHILIQLSLGQQWVVPQRLDRVFHTALFQLTLKALSATLATAATCGNAWGNAGDSLLVFLALSHLIYDLT